MEDKKYITSDNWTFTHYTTADLQVFIHLGAQPNAENPENIDMLYLLTVLKDEEEELFQWEFQELHQAINTINDKYSSWELKERAQATGGCGTCSAH